MSSCAPQSAGCLSIADPRIQWTRKRLWRLYIPILMGFSQRLSADLGPLLALSVMILVHYWPADWTPAALAQAWSVRRGAFAFRTVFARNCEHDRFRR
jgi:hypothetical protein